MKGGSKHIIKKILIISIIITLLITSNSTTGSNVKNEEESLEIKIFIGFIDNLNEYESGIYTIFEFNCKFVILLNYKKNHGYNIEIINDENPSGFYQNFIPDENSTMSFYKGILNENFIFIVNLIKNL
jgi:hypothetical protein